MIETEITIELNRLSDLDKIKGVLKRQKIQVPIYILEYDSNVSVKFAVDYEFYELNDAIANCYNGYEFISDLGSGPNEILMKIYRYQSPLQSDGWGRQIENPLNEILYLVKKVKTQIAIPKSKVTVLFEDLEKEYFINIGLGKRKGTDEKGFLVLEGFDHLLDKSLSHPHVPRLHKNLIDAYWDGYRRLIFYVDGEFEKYMKEKKKQIRKQKAALKKAQGNGKS